MGKTRRVEELGYATKTTKAAQVTHCSHLHENSADCRIKRSTNYNNGCKRWLHYYLISKAKIKNTKKVDSGVPQIVLFFGFQCSAQGLKFLNSHETCEAVRLGL